MRFLGADGERALNARLLLMGAALGFVVVQLDVTIVKVALRQIAVSFGKWG